jgi:hypothetical protein
LEVSIEIPSQRASLIVYLRVILGVEDLRTHFQSLAKQKAVPTLDKLLYKSDMLIQQYVSIGAYERVLSIQNQCELKLPTLKVKVGTEWTSQAVTSSSTEQISDDEVTKDNEDFDGDRSLANSILFKTQFASWLLLEYAIKDGDMGRVLEQLKVTDTHLYSL